MTEQGLVARAARGEGDALGVLYARHVRPVYRFALAELRSREDAEDVTQEVFLTLASRARPIMLSSPSALPWLLVTCRNLCRNKQRARAVDDRRRASLEVAAEIPAPGSVEEAAELAELRRAVRAAIDALSPDDRRLVELCLDGDSTYRDAATTLGLSHAGVRNRLSRLRARLRQSLTQPQEVNQP